MGSAGARVSASPGMDLQSPHLVTRFFIGRRRVRIRGVDPNCPGLRGSPSLEAAVPLFPHLAASALPGARAATEAERLISRRKPAQRVE